MNKTISIQEFLSPALPQVIGCKDYADEERLLKRVDRILTISGVETLFLHLSMEEFEANANKMVAAGEKVLVGPRAIERYQRHSRRALRCTVLKAITHVEGYREMSRSLAKCPLYRWFCVTTTKTDSPVESGILLPNIGRCLMIDVTKQLWRTAHEKRQQRSKAGGGGGDQRPLSEGHKGDERQDPE